MVKTERIKKYRNNITSLNEQDHYKYLGIFESDNIKHTEIKK